MGDSVEPTADAGRPDPELFADQPGERAAEAAGEAAADGGGPGLGEQLVDALMATDPHPPVETLEDTYGVDESVAYVIRGANKVAHAVMGGDMSQGTPAIVDIGRGALTWLWQRAAEGDQDWGRGGREE